MKPGQQRKKGHDWERKVASMLREATPGCTAKRGQQAHNADDPDVSHEWFRVECKHRKRPNVLKALEEGERVVDATRTHLAVVRWDGMAPEQAVVALRLGDFLELMGELWKARND